MPCTVTQEEKDYFAGRTREETTNTATLDELQQVKKECALATGVACALMSTFHEEFPGLINKAAARGKVDIWTWWEKHQEEDMINLKKAINAFSKDELKNLKTLLNEDLTI